MWEYTTFETSSLQDVGHRLNFSYDRDWEVLTISETRQPVDPESPDYRWRMWCSTFTVLMRRKKIDGN